ncbi:hypothetical protein DRQ20_01510 [bacterium]|nr:MAG: hypothetical protein DRQ20_01510 [bacterium]
MLRCWGKGFVDMVLGVMGFGSVLTLFKRLKEKCAEFDKLKEDIKKLKQENELHMKKYHPRKVK